MSRLPPAMVTKSLSQHRADRPIVFRSFSEESGVSRMSDKDCPGSSPTIEHPHYRHLSQCPRISGVPVVIDNDADENKSFVLPIDRPRTSDSVHRLPTNEDYFGLLMTDSPIQTSAPTEPSMVPLKGREETSCTSSSGSSQQVRSRNDSSSSQLDPTFAISPPVRPLPNHESSEDDYTSSTTGSSFSYPRKLSASSGISVPHSPLSPLVPVHPPRSPSINSEASVNGVTANRIPPNFSRPRSSASLSVLSRPDSPAMHQFVDSQIRQPVNMPGTLNVSARVRDAESADNDGCLPGGGPSYTYTKFSLPRGRMVSRDSAVFQGLSTPHFEWNEPLFQKASVPTVRPEMPLALPSSAPRSCFDPQQDKFKTADATFTFEFKTLRPTTPEQPIHEQPSKSPSQSLNSSASPQSTTSPKGRISVETGDLKSMHAPPAPREEAEDTNSISSKSNSTLRPTTARAGVTNTTGYHYMSPDDHVTKGIECHENGSLQESTYHLRIAAMQNHPTAMLLYALACRHGWGMRPNQREGMQWLRKALDCAMLEVAEDEDSSSATGVRDFHDKKARKAQFALSIYELGVSHLNGWGIEQDRVLALRCFEVAGHWGDVDALTEAGFCYAEGVGCRKDLKKAAKFYRMAEQRGVSMVGNSW